METFEQWFERDRAHKKAMDKKNREIFVELEAALQIAELKHPVFAVSFEEGMMRVMEEVGEACQANNKRQGDERRGSEVLDALVTIWRLYREDWREDAG